MTLWIMELALEVDKDGKEGLKKATAKADKIALGRDFNLYPCPDGVKPEEALPYVPSGHGTIPNPWEPTEHQ